MFQTKLHVFLFIIIHLELKDNQLFVPQKSEEIVRGGLEQSQDEATISHNDKQKLKKSQAAIGISFNVQLKESKNYNNQTKLNLYADSKLLNRFIFNYCIVLLVTSILFVWVKFINSMHGI